MAVRQAADKEQRKHGTGAVQFHRPGFERMHAFTEFSHSPHQVMSKQPQHASRHQPGADAVSAATLPALGAQIDKALWAGRTAQAVLSIAHRSHYKSSSTKSLQHRMSRVPACHYDLDRKSVV